MEDFNSKYTGEEVENILDSVGSKQDTISDLETIRDGASKGATALQSSDIDAELNIESSNPIQNKVVTEALNTIIDDTVQLVGDLLDTFDNYQPIISDLATIRSGAEKGATSVQSSDIEDVARKDSDYVIANGILDENDDYWHLPKNSLNDKEHTLASKSDIEEKILVIGDSSDEAKANFIAVANGEKTADVYIGSVATQGYIVEGCVKLARSGSSSNLMHSFTIIGSPTAGQYVNKLIKVICCLVNGEISSEVNVIGTYSKPSTGIPKTDLENDVQNALNKAENAVSKDKVGDMDVLPTQGFFEQSNGAVYALPNSSTGDEDDILLSRNTVKTINGESIFGSGNITISGGSSSSGSGAYSEVNHGTSDTTFTLTPNTFHVWDEVANLTLTLGSETSGVANEFLFQFTSGATATSLTLPDDIKWANELAIEPNMIYQVSILKGLASMLEFDNAPSLIENKVTVSISGTKYLVSLQYAAASDLVVKVRTIDGGIFANIASGQISGSANSISPIMDSDAYIESVVPEVDSTYIYKK